ncbi:hypothetical protein KC343_g4824 [Hortaea werneckii]|uniref:Uncharacterized protein n=1 Tax=Hortaea werneckii TaxID=91943 RepID=A0A3M7H7G9_HORWE|nr:hypothetical protein KC352_g15034 [Hortaea werneckii]KAI7570290.1 hypothetical protein KC317_g2591 [Hortaea werneckii]KAI7622958.1 hypothetical protein KC346_g2967 [Hortaea werneckii]KAI7630119.1 hypothetical protein KC343_g4824 [Hortaea werneckii]KAI7668904.1 hypothetical protein KC319_g6266 [Hortaea werneckii]
MSWLSPKRRRTTGNLKTLPNGDQQPSSIQPPPATGSSNDDSVTVDSNAISLPTRPRIQPTAALHGKKIPGQSSAKRPTTLARPLSQPLMSTATLQSGDGTANGEDGNGNLFYAYARKANDLQSRYLLTFANAAIASEWWSLLQEHFHDVSRPSPQLFSFKDPELLSKAWKNTSFAHLKSKWMYISFSDTASNQLGGAAQGIIPIQDAAGNLLGGGAPANSGEVKQAREETREAKQEISRLEERFGRMMEAIEKNGDRMASLLEERQERIDAKDQDYGRSDPSELSSHLEKITGLLAKNSEYVQGVEKRQASNEKALREELKKLNAKPKEKGSNMSQLSSHLDRIQKMMEHSITDRKDGSTAESQTVQIDLSPLIERLTKVQEAVEQNSALVKELLDDGANSESRAMTPFWGKTTPIEHPQQQFQPLDLSPLTEHLEKIHHAIEQQSNHMQALVGFASGGDEESGSADGGGGGSSSVATTGYAGGDTAERSLAPLGEHLEQIYNAIEQGNTQAQKHWAQQDELQQRSQQAVPVDLKPLLEAQDRTRLAVEAGNKVDMGPLVAMFDGLIEHMGSIREDSRSVDSHLQELIRKQNELTDTFVVTGSKTLDVGPLAEKLDQVNEHLEILREWSEFSAERWQEFIDARGIEMEERRGDVKAEMGMLEGRFDTLSEHVQALRASSNTSIGRLHELLQKPQQDVQTSSRPPSASSDIDLTPLNDRLTRIHDSLERQVVMVRGGSGGALEKDDYDHDDDGNEIQAGRRGGARTQPSANLASGAGDPKFLITALTSHLSKIQAVTDTNAQQLSRLLHTFPAPTGVNKPHHQQRKLPQQPNHHPHNPAPPAESLSDPAPMSRHTTTPAAASAAAAAQQDHRLEATHSQVRELMAGQREMIDAVRELAKSIRAEKGGSCEHVVIPPPRKVGRKVVGFVYDGKGRGGG